MPIGERANNPKTPYYVYEFSFDGRVFYVGQGYHPVEILGRYRFVRLKLDHREKNSKLLSRTVIAVIVAMIDAHYPEGSLTVSTKYLLTHTEDSTGVTEQRNPELWSGLGKQNALDPERKQIAKRIDEGCVLANAQLLPPGRTPATLDEVLRYLGIDSKARRG
jgi:hypothetical protein